MADKPINRSTFDLDAYIKYQRSLIDLERNADKQQEEQRLNAANSVPLEQNVANNSDGTTLYNMIYDDSESNAHIYGRKLCHFITKNAFTAQKSTPLPRHSLSPRDPILLRPKMPQGKSGITKAQQTDMEIRGVIYSVQIDRIIVSLDVSEISGYLSNNNPVDLIKLRSDFLFDQLSASLSLLHSANLSELHPSRGVLDSLFFSKPPTTKAPQNKPILGPSQNLNFNQSQALSIAVQLPSTQIIFGPPGTGKSETLSQIIQQLSILKKKILFCAPSNTAVDVMVERLHSSATSPSGSGSPHGGKCRIPVFTSLSGMEQQQHRDAPSSTSGINPDESNLPTQQCTFSPAQLEEYKATKLISGFSITDRELNVVRVGHPARMSELVLDHALDNLVKKNTSSSNADRKRLQTLSRQLNNTYSNINPSSDGAGSKSGDFYDNLNKSNKHTSHPSSQLTSHQNRKEMWQEYNQLRKEVAFLERSEASNLVKNADVVACTLSGSNSHLITALPLDHFDVVIIDEAAQSTEIGMINALLKGQSLIIAGDHLQLPPTIMNPSAVEQGLSVTLMERLINYQQFSNQVFQNEPRLTGICDPSLFPLNDFTKLLPKSFDMITTTVMLREQYRMNYIVGNWASTALYQGQLKPGNENVGFRSLQRMLYYNDQNKPYIDDIMDVDRSSIDLSNPSAEDYIDVLNGKGHKVDRVYSSAKIGLKTHKLLSPFIVIDTAGDHLEDNQADCETESSASGAPVNKTSKRNKGEVDYVLQQIKCLLESGIHPKNITVLSPYRSQVTLLSDTIKSQTQSITPKLQTDTTTTSASSPSPPLNISDVDVSTIDAIQGQEKECIIISLVRSNLHQSIGFLSENRRLNVAITRAKRQVVIIGDCGTLEVNDFLRKIISYQFSCYFHHLDYLDIAAGKITDGSIERGACKERGEQEGRKSGKQQTRDRANAAPRIGPTVTDTTDRVLATFNEQWVNRDTLKAKCIAQLANLFDFHFNALQSKIHSDNAELNDKIDQLEQLHIVADDLRQSGDETKQTPTEQSQETPLFSMPLHLHVDVLADYLMKTFHLQSNQQVESNGQNTSQLFSLLKQTLQQSSWRFELFKYKSNTLLTLGERKLIHHQLDEILIKYTKALLKQKRVDDLERDEVLRKGLKADKIDAKIAKLAVCQKLSQNHDYIDFNRMLGDFYNYTYSITHVSDDMTQSDTEKVQSAENTNAPDSTPVPIDKSMKITLFLRLEVKNTIIDAVLKEIQWRLDTIDRLTRKQLAANDSVSYSNIDPVDNHDNQQNQDEGRIGQTGLATATVPSTSTSTTTTTPEAHSPPSALFTPIDIKYKTHTISIALSQANPSFSHLQDTICDYTGIIPKKQQLVSRGKKITDDKTLPFVFALPPKTTPMIMVIGVASKEPCKGPLSLSAVTATIQSAQNDQQQPQPQQTGASKTTTPTSTTTTTATSTTSSSQTNPTPTQTTSKPTAQSVQHSQSKTTQPVKPTPSSKTAQQQSTKPLQTPTKSTSLPKVHPLLAKHNAKVGMTITNNTTSSSDSDLRSGTKVKQSGVRNLQDDATGAMTSNQLARMVFDSPDYQYTEPAENPSKTEHSDDKTVKPAAHEDSKMDKLDAILSDMRVGKCQIDGCENKLKTTGFTQTSKSACSCAQCGLDYCSAHRHPFQHNCSHAVNKHGGPRVNGHNSKHDLDNMTKRDHQQLDYKFQQAMNNKQLQGTMGNVNNKKEDDKKKKKK